MEKKVNSTTYLPVGLNQSPSFAFLNENNFTLLRASGKADGHLRGPRRVLRLCLFAFLLPAVLITIPLYVRLVLYPPSHYPMMPTDQRLLNKHVSSVWCQAQSARMNGTFSAFVTSGPPQVTPQQRHHAVLHHLTLTDDVKEYWGFHLLKGSHIHVSACSSNEGAQLMMLRGVENLRRCAWIGQEDSDEDDDERATLNEQQEGTGMGGKVGREHDDWHRRGEAAGKVEEGEVEMGQENGKQFRARFGKVQGKADTNQGKVAKAEETEVEVEEERDAETVQEENKNSGGVNKPSGKRTGRRKGGKKGTKGSAMGANNGLGSVEANETTAIPSFPSTHDTHARNDEEEVLLEEEEEPEMEDEAVDHESKSEERRNDLQKLLRKAMRLSKGKKEILGILHAEGQRSSEQQRLPPRIQHILGVQQESSDNDSRQVSRTRQVRSLATQDHDDAREELDDDEDYSRAARSNGGSDGQEEQLVGHQVFMPEGLLLERGSFNQTNRGDGSREEDMSSYSSSEEALASCEGVIMALPLLPYRACSQRWTEVNKFSYRIPATATYYFVFSSENEIKANEIYFNLTFERVVYDTSKSEVVCANQTSCLAPLTFWADQQLVVEVAEGDSWDRSYVLDTSCDPRVPVYLTFIFLVPILIMCAFSNRS